jgi:hypothetical protein
MNPRRTWPAVLAALLAAVAAVAAVALGACGGGSGDKADPGAPPPAGPAHEPFLGVSLGALSSSPELIGPETKVMARSGVTSLRAPLYWNELEPRPGHLRLAAVDGLVAAAARARLDVLPVVLGTPGWAAANPYLLAASPPRDPKDYAAFLRALIRRYGPNGTLWSQRPSLPKVPIRAWQIWNEPSHDYYWAKQPFAPSYVRLLKVADQAVHGADPGAKTVLAGFPDRSWESLAQVEKAGASGSFDVAAVHPYTAKVADVLKIVKLDRAALRAAGDGGVPMWLTEVAWSSGLGKVKRNQFGFETTERGQAQRLTEALPLLAAQRRRLGIQRIYWETWASGDKSPDSTWDWAGLRVLRNGTVAPKPAYQAFVRVARQIQPG